jgi:hypothetical protein
VGPLSENLQLVFQEVLEFMDTALDGDVHDVNM